MKKVLSLVLSLVMLLSLVVPVSAEDTYPGSGNLTDKTAAFTIEADKTTLYDNGGEQIVKFHIYAESKDNVPIRAFQFTLVPSANLTLATELAADNAGFNYAYQNAGKLIKIPASNPNGMYELFEYKPDPDSRYFGAAGTDEGKGITAPTEIMTIMGKVNGVGDYTLSMSGVVAGNGDAPNNIAEKFTCTVAGATVTVKPEGERPQPNLSLALSTDKVKVGDTFTATLSNKGMTVSSFIAQLEFDKEMLAVTKIEQLGGFAKLAADATIDPVLSTPDEANDRSLVGVGFVRGSDKTHEAGEFLRVTFQTKAAGNTAISLYEDSVGADGYRGDISGGVVTVSAAAHVHSLVATPAVAATETAPGNSAYWTCSGCGKYFSDAEGKNEVVKDSWVIPATGHELTKTEAKAATCTETGNNEYWTCSVCKKVFKADKTTETTVEAETISALKHDYVYSTVTPATPSSNGEVSKECSRCHEKSAEQIEYSENGFNLSIGEATVHKGKIKVPVTVRNNPGISGIKFTVAYDETKIKLTGVELAAGVSGMCNQIENNVAWVSSADIDRNGELLYLEFEVIDSSAASNVSIGLKYQVDDVMNIAKDRFRFGVVPGTVKITAPGDIDGDGSVLLADISLLLRYYNAIGTSVQVDVVEGSCDVDGDGTVLLADISTLLRYYNAIGTTQEGTVKIH